MSKLGLKPTVATEEHLKLPWLGGKDGEFFRCCLCGHRFVVGDVWRWVYTNNTKDAFGNPFVCERCDGPDVVERWRMMHREVKELREGRLWWFLRRRDT